MVEEEPHPTWDTKTSIAINSIRVLNALTAESQVNLKRIRRVRSYVTLPTNRNVRITKTALKRRDDIVLEHMGSDDATGLVKAEWVEYVPDASFFAPASPHSVKDESSNTDPAVLYLHGGGYALCSRKTHRGLTWKVAKHAKSRVLAIDYRLAPEHVFPLALHDAISAYSFLLSNGRPASKIIICGDSAGGGLALALTLWLRDNGPSHNLPLPAGVILMSPWLDLSHSLPSFKNGKFDLLREKVIDSTVITETRSHFYISDNSFLKHPLVSPLFAQENLLAPLPPLLIQVGDAERLRDESIVFATSQFSQSPIRLEIYEGMVHVFQMLASFIKVADRAMERLGSFAQEAIARQEQQDSCGLAEFERRVEWISNDAKHDFPVRSMTSAEVTELLEGSSGQVAEEVSSVMAEVTTSGDSAESEVEFLGSCDEGPMVPMPER
ncbi:hypothetical protein BCR33DRAFT_154810 [Rhizoclosmatium globosum]|uniref:Alpha/beta hydrolase fold-3 domain-containing protein n=1 Tax=Rhizoclosmatium globosum TaxID=329046 RepID=A0A1Y2CFR3_9FUNG|nr:hypothetical protein BCR33DRAFT_154810 [Rhizoclosmatium globosum]|eukprot:ORY45903.1 hypothetical protein BCR33DRAFT_154810 [Rhizoclosmatium globosum]